jgi:hypothetical protein
MTSSSRSDVRADERAVSEETKDHHAERDQYRGEHVALERLNEADLALMLALQSWASLGPRLDFALNQEGAMEAGGTEQLSRLEASWARRLRAARADASTAPLVLDARAALARLRRMHETAVRVDLTRVHPSWCVRALKEESPTVQRLIAACAPEHLRNAIRIGLSLDADELTGERPVDPEVLGWLLALWTERLVGGDPARTDDPPAIAALCHLSPRAGYALCRVAGQIKSKIGGQPPAQGRQSATRHARMKWIAENLSDADPQFVEQVSRDRQSKALAKVPDRHVAARLGVQTLARLLADCEPFRVRWALQHWPYPIAKLIRSLMPARAQGPAWLAQAERQILKEAWNCLTREGRLTLPWPDS